jgi:hypothetical protein
MAAKAAIVGPADDGRVEPRIRAEQALAPDARRELNVRVAGVAGDVTIDSLIRLPHVEHCGRYEPGGHHAYSPSRRQVRSLAGCLA